MRLDEVATLAVSLLLASCGDVDDKILGAWQRVQTGSELIPHDSHDRLYFTQEGWSVREIGAGSVRGRYDIAGYDLTIRWPSATWVGLAWNPPCPQPPGRCLELKGQGEDDVFRELTLFDGVYY